MSQELESPKQMKSQTNQTRIGQIIEGKLNSYRVKSVLGHGAISEVLLGSIIKEQTEGCEEDVAIKVLRSTTFIGNQENKYFFQEQDIVRKLSSQRDEHIVNIYEVIETDGEYFIVMEFCENGSLLDQIFLDIPNRLKVVVNFSIQLAKGIQFLHIHDIAHRDLKPENIFIHQILGQYILKIGDYGLGKSEEISIMKSCIGTINYMAPEMIRKEEYDSSVDVWALGCIMHELLTGEQLFADYTIADISNQIKSITEYQCICGQFGILIRKCLQPTPKNRIQILELSEGLIEFYEDIVNNNECNDYNVIIYKSYREQILNSNFQQNQLISIDNFNTPQQISQKQQSFNHNEENNFNSDMNSNLLMNYQSQNKINKQTQYFINEEFQNFDDQEIQEFDLNFIKEYDKAKPVKYGDIIFLQKNLNSQIKNKTGENSNHRNNDIQDIEFQGFLKNDRINDKKQYQNNHQNMKNSSDSKNVETKKKKIQINHKLYEDKDTQQALKRKAQFNQKKEKTHKIKKGKDLMVKLQLKHVNSEIFLEPIEDTLSNSYQEQQNFTQNKKKFGNSPVFQQQQHYQQSYQQQQQNQQLLLEEFKQPFNVYSSRGIYLQPSPQVTLPLKTKNKEQQYQKWELQQNQEKQNQQFEYQQKQQQLFQQEPENQNHQHNPHFFNFQQSQLPFCITLSQDPTYTQFQMEQCFQYSEINKNIQYPNKTNMSNDAPLSLFNQTMNEQISSHNQLSPSIPETHQNDFPSNCIHCENDRSQKLENLQNKNNSIKNNNENNQIKRGNQLPFSGNVNSFYSGY